MTIDAIKEMPTPSMHRIAGTGSGLLGTPRVAEESVRSERFRVGRTPTATEAVFV